MRVKESVSIETIFIPLSYKIKPMKSMAKARRSEAGESKKSS